MRQLVDRKYLGIIISPWQKLHGHIDVNVVSVCIGSPGGSICQVLACWSSDPMFSTSSRQESLLKVNSLLSSPSHGADMSKVLLKRT